MIDCKDCKKNNLKHFSSNYVAGHDNPLFSFNYMTTNNNYNFKRIKNNELDDFKIKLIEKLIELEKNYKVKDLMSLRKKTIYESFSLDEIKFRGNNISSSNDTKVHVFRITSDYRMLCIFSDVAPLFYVIGFDFRYDAYCHG